MHPFLSCGLLLAPLAFRSHLQALYTTLYPPEIVADGVYEFPNEILVR